MEKIRFIIVGSGWRSLYYVRIADALKERFELCALLCRTKEKAQSLSDEYGIHATTSEDECVSLKPDFVVVAVDKTSLADVAIHWAKLGFCILMETPAAVDKDKLRVLLSLSRCGCKIVVNEQYHQYPVYKALLKIADSGILGERQILNLSVAHDYHGMSLLRDFLGIPYHESFTIQARNYEFPSVRTMSRFERYRDGVLETKKRTVATFEFESGKVALHDFDPDQYRSPIRLNTLKLQGSRGEIVDGRVCYLDGDFEPVDSEISIIKYPVHKDLKNPNLSDYDEILDVRFENRSLYRPPFGACRLPQDETAMACMMEKTFLYAKGISESPYPMEKAAADAYSTLMLYKAIESGAKVNVDFSDLCK